MLAINNIKGIRTVNEKYFHLTGNSIFHIETIEFLLLREMLYRRKETAEELHLRSILRTIQRAQTVGWWKFTVHFITKIAMNYRRTMTLIARLPIRIMLII